MKTSTHYFEKWPNLKNWQQWFGQAKIVVVADQRVGKDALEHLGRIGHCLSVSAGEGLKRPEAFVKLAEEVLEVVAGCSAQEIILVAVGGGTVGDAVGFLASVLKRGVRLVHVPSTYLAALDSAHGGKTALNVGGFKNQIGTIYPAERVIVIRELLAMQPSLNLRSAYGELIKMAILAGGSLFQNLERTKTFDESLFWKVLPTAVLAKNKIVVRDPFEKKGIRQLLNLGHTVGHALEVEQNLPHGLAVQLGLEFSLELSRKHNLIGGANFQRLAKILAKNKTVAWARIPSKKLREYLSRDKKSRQLKYVRFVLVKKPGQAVVRELSIAAVVSAAKDFGWAR